jgi:ABC-2 type transport system permease protein
MLFSRMVREERHSRQELLYAKPLGRNAMYLTYLGVAVLASVLAEFVFSASIWLAQSRDADALAFVVVLRSGFVYLPAIVFVLGLQALSVGFAPRWSGAVWVYLGFSFLISYVGKVLEFPDWVKKVSVFHAIPELPVASMDWPHVVVVAVLSVCLLAVGLLRYRRRDLISG